ncbi:unnamed protein product [Owenia fusiformis]|uniref:Uncharacterized protein n=1 Tax=Owenia fusiformis TaxID=6347 RepID=A0A8J1TT22_OWEFU|nr:unnamed protein product [Owenia fusiformis]
MGNTIYLPTTKDGKLTTREVALSEVELAALVVGVVLGAILIISLAALLIYSIKQKNKRRRKREEVKKNLAQSTIRRELHMNKQKYVPNGRPVDNDISSGNGNSFEQSSPNYLTNTRLVQKYKRQAAPSRARAVARSDNTSYYYQWWDPRSWWYYWNTRASNAPAMQYYGTQNNTYHTMTRY